MRRVHLALAACGLALGAAGMAKAQTVSAHGRSSSSSSASSSSIARWQASLDAFAAEDRAHEPRNGGVLFVGSSSIRLWDGLETAFSSEPSIVKRGFGGSRLADCAEFLDRLVLPYKPRLIVVYAGDNDLAEGASPTDVLGSFRSFVEGVRKALPDTRIAYLSIKPSPLREALLTAAKTTNALIADYVHAGDNLDFIDIYSKMLDAEGRPRRELFGSDSLHLNEQGYSLWKTVISEHLSARPRSLTASR